MKEKSIAITCTTKNRESEARSLAKQLNLDYLYNEDQMQGFNYLLVFTPNYLGLHKVSDKKFSPFYIDFLSGKMRFRMQHASLRKELLARAIGLKPSQDPHIIDATAGLGRDSFILATLGYHVTMLERSPILFSLLQDALNRAQQNAILASICAKLNLIQTNAILYLKKIHPQHHPHVIYLDPMFPKRKKTAAVKKEMIILQDLLGSEDDEEELFLSAQACALNRVVVKRSRFDRMIAERTPTFSMAGKSSRFDIYLTRA